MRQLLLGIINVLNDRTKHRKRLHLLVCLLLVAFLLSFLPMDDVQAASGLRIYSYATKKETTYKDKRIKVTFNGKQISKDSTPGLLMNGIALVSYKDVFQDSSIAADCVYNSSKGTVSITKYATTIVMTIGSKKAIINGKSVTMAVEPIKVKYVDANKIEILVPSRFVSENLGLNYTWDSSKSTVAIQKESVTISYEGVKKFEYTGTLGKVTVDGKSVNLGNMPSILINNTAMLQAKKVFADSSIKADYNYDDSTKTLTLTKNGNRLVMQLGSKTAYLNGNKVAMDEAPISVKNYTDNNSYLMVPGSVTAASLGYNYAWDKVSATSKITSRKVDTGSSGGSGTGNSGSGHGQSPELGGDSGVENEVGVIFNQWQSNYPTSTSPDRHEILGTAPITSQTRYIYSVNRNFNNSTQNSETFAIASTAKFYQVTSNRTDRLISIKASDQFCYDTVYPMLGANSNLVNSIHTSNNAADSSTTIDFDMLTDNFSYDISLSEDGTILYVTIYLNSLTAVSIGTNNSGDYITMTGLTPLKPVLTQDGAYFYIDLPYTTNSIGDIYASFTSAKFMKLCYAINQTDKIRFVFAMGSGYEYYTSEDGNKYTISFSAPGTATTPNTPQEIDTGSCEIKIPLPAGITKNMLTDDDYYKLNKFVIRIPGNQAAFYQSNPVSYSTNSITGVNVSVNSSNDTEILFTTSHLLGYEYYIDDGNIYVNVGEPREIYKNIVVLDAGHGGPANGCQYFGTKEKDINLKILYTLGKKYFNSDPKTLKVYYTRTSDVDMTLNDRAIYAGKMGADLFVSLHMNASYTASASGTEVYYSLSNNTPNRVGLTSKTLAGMMLNNLTGALGTTKRGVMSEKFTVVHRNTVPAILIELGYLSNKNDHALLTDPGFQDNAARTIYETLLQVFKQYPTGR